jgi:hypothetical protein
VPVGSVGGVGRREARCADGRPQGWRRAGVTQGVGARWRRLVRPSSCQVPHWICFVLAYLNVRSHLAPQVIKENKLFF